MLSHLARLTVVSPETYRVLILSALLFLPTLGPVSAETPTSVNVDNFARAETDMQIARMLKMGGTVNKWTHNRQPTPLDKQTVNRMNRDTLYSCAVVDSSEGATVTMPDAGERYMSLMVENNDGYVNEVFNGGGTYKLTMDEFDTPYVVLAVRTLVDASDDADVKAANALQDQMKIEAASSKPFVMPNYDKKSYEANYGALLEMAKWLPGAGDMFGKKGEVDPMRFIIGAAFGWGGLPEEEASYLNVSPNLPVGKYQITVRDVPVDAFWSISMYNKDGYFEKNDLNAYSVNNISNKPNANGSFTVHLGGCEDKPVNCLPLTEGWNYIVRLYRPREEILDGTWTFPSPQPVKQ